MKELEHTIDEIPELILENEVRVKKAFDPHIASIALRPKTNDPTEGYGLAASAVFGSENVIIPIDDGAGKEREIFEFRFEMFQAELVIDTARCRLDNLFERDKSVQRPIPVSAYTGVDNRERSTKIKVDSGSMLEDVTGAKLGFEHNVQRRRDVPPDAWYEVTFLDDKTIQFTSKGANPVPLRGQLLDEFLGWRIIPDVGVSSGILGRLRTRESWIKLVDPKPVGPIGRWTRALFRLLKGKGERYRYRRKAFDLLLSYLVAEGLQNGAETRDATLAVDTVIVRPSMSGISKVEAERRDRMLEFEGHPIADFLRSPVGSERRVLIAIGVSEARIEALGLPPAAIEVDKGSVAPNSPTLEYLIELYIDAVMSVARPVNTEVEAIVPLIMGSITGRYRENKNISLHKLKTLRILMNKIDCKLFIESAFYKSSKAEYTQIFVDKLSKLKNRRGRYEVSFNQLAVFLFDREYVSSHIKNNAQRIEQTIRMYPHHNVESDP